MARPGPKGKSNIIKMNQGTMRPCRDREQVVETIEGEAVRPKWLKGLAREIWNEKVLIYKTRGQPVAGFEDTLAMYCALEASLIQDYYKKKLAPPVAMINAHRVYANEFFDTPASQHIGTKKPKDSNPFSKNGRK